MSYSISTDDPQVGDVVDVRRNADFYCTGRIEVMTHERNVLWIEGTAALPRTAFLREGKAEAWTSR